MSLKKCSYPAWSIKKAKKDMKGDLGAEPPAGSGAKPLSGGHEAKPPEAESFSVVG